MSLKHIKHILKTLSFEEQVVLLSDQCILNAYDLWNEIGKDDIMNLPISPFANQNFSPIYVNPETFELLLKHALQTYADPRRKSINFYYWLNDSRVKPQFYFSSTPKVSRKLTSVLNYFMFYAADTNYRNWILSSLETYLTEIFDSILDGKCDDLWHKLLEIFILPQFRFI